MSIFNDYRLYSDNPDEYEQWKQERDYEYRKQEIDDRDYYNDRFEGEDYDTGDD